MKKPWPYDEGRVIFMARFLSWVGADPMKILADACGRALGDNLSRLQMQLQAVEVRGELEELTRAEPNTKKAVLLRRLADARNVKYETLRDILARAKEHPSPAEKAVFPAGPADELLFAALAAGRASGDERRGPPPNTKPLRAPAQAGIKRSRGGKHDERKAPDDRRSRRVSRTPSANAKAVADERRLSTLREDFREPRPLQPRGAQGVGRGADSSKHGRRRPRSLKGPPP